MRPFCRILCLVSILAAALAVLPGCGDSSSSPGDVIEGGDAEPDAALLKAYGVQTNLGEPTGSDGSVLPAGYNPLGRTLSTLFPRREIFVSGIQYNSDSESTDDSRAMLLDDAARGNKVLWHTGSSTDTWVDSPNVAAAADVDSDGVQEVVVLRFAKTGGGKIAEKSNPGTASLTVLSHPKAYDMGQPVPIPGSFDLTTRDTGDAHYLLALAAADVDGDGADELAAVIGNTLVFLDDAAHEFAPLADPLDFRHGDLNAATSTLHVTRVAAADLNGDGRDEVVVIDGADGNATCSWYAYAVQDPTATPPRVTQIATGAVSNGSQSMPYGNVAIGDIDGDGRPEVVFAGSNAGDSKSDTRWLLAARWDGTTLQFLPKSYRFSSDWGDHEVMALHVFNPDGIEADAASSIQVDRWVVSLDKDTGEFGKRFDIDTDGYLRDLAVTGDVLGNHREQVVLQQGGDLNVYGIDDGGNWKKVASWDVDRKAYVGMALPEIDGESLVVMYTGRHQLKFADPKVVAVIASPPYWGDLQADQGNVGNSETTFSTSRDEETEKAHSFSVEASFSVGTHAEAPLLGATAFEMEVKNTFSANFDYRTAKAVELEFEQGWSCPSGEDQVIVTTVPFDVYWYQVRASPSAVDLNSEFPINVPRKPQIIPFERHAFEDLNGGRVPFDPAVLGHTIGEPHTYPTKAQMQDLIDASRGAYLWDPEGMAVGVGNGLTWKSVSQEKTTSTTFGVGIGYTFEVEATVGGAMFGSSLGFSYGYESTVSTSEGTAISGVVANLPPGSDLATYQYTYGVSAYKPDGTYFVVTYWVE